MISQPIRPLHASSILATSNQRAEAWRSSSLWQRVHTTQGPWLGEWPLALPKQRTKYVNKVETEAKLEALRRSVVCGAPYGDEGRQRQTAAALGLVLVAGRLAATEEESTRPLILSVVGLLFGLYPDQSFTLFFLNFRIVGG